MKELNVAHYFLKDWDKFQFTSKCITDLIEILDNPTNQMSDHILRESFVGSRYTAIDFLRTMLSFRELRDDLKDFRIEKLDKYAKLCIEELA